MTSDEGVPTLGGHARLPDITFEVSAWVPVFSPLAVAWVVFRLALRQEAIKWSRERRAEVYVDALVEATAERDWVERQLPARTVVR